MPIVPQSEIQVKILKEHFKETDENRGEILAKLSVDFRPSISREIGHKKFHTNSSTHQDLKFHTAEPTFFHNDTLGVGGRKNSECKLSSGRSRGSREICACFRGFSSPSDTNEWSSQAKVTNLESGIIGYLGWSFYAYNSPHKPTENNSWGINFCQDYSMTMSFKSVSLASKSVKFVSQSVIITAKILRELINNSCNHYRLITDLNVHGIK